MKKISTLLTFICLFVAISASAQSLDFENVAPHPRLILTKGDVSKMRELPAKSTNAGYIHDLIISTADGYLAAEPVTREISAGRMWSVSREALKRIFYLSYAHVMTDDMRYVAAAEREMLAASAFEDWNPSHFLDVAEMTMALSIGYDWLYRRLSVHSRSIIGTAIYEKGLLPATDESVKFWDLSNNWNQVCNAGMIYGALATLERSPEFCKELIAKCLESNKKAQKMYEPDGAYPEGYAYWEYGSGFEAMLVAALESSLATDAGIADNKSFMQSAEFMNHMVAPSGLVYNFGDCNITAASSIPAKYWFARKTGNTSLVALDEKLIASKRVSKDALLPLYMICATAMDLSKVHLPEVKSWHSRGELPVYVYRSGWDSDDAYLAVKGGKASTNHAHMDAGSFIYEYDGVRWTLDLGRDDYGKVETAGVDLWNMTQQSSRWNLFRMGAASHNTITINDKQHCVDGKAEIVEFYNTSREKGADVDMTPVFADQAQSVVRSVKLDKNNHLTVTDHIKNGNQPSKIDWKIVTKAQAEIVSPNTIMLTQDGKVMYLRLNGRYTATAKISSDHKLKDCEAKAEGISCVGFEITLKAGEVADIEVSLSPLKKKGVKISLPTKLPELNILKNRNAKR